eukprot:scaffold53991_cov69-Phaeocystis_antarctica.AAC.2
MGWQGAAHGRTRPSPTLRRAAVTPRAKRAQRVRRGVRTASRQRTIWEAYASKNTTCVEALKYFRR